MMLMHQKSELSWAIVPAAGFGQRMRLDTPKQYLNLAGIPILQRSIDALLDAIPQLNCIAVLADDDSEWSRLSASCYARMHTVTGGATRADSVMAGLRYVIENDDTNPWVLVHDAARPLVNKEDIVRLVDAVIPNNEVGGLLAVPVQDTLKHEKGVSSPRVDRTVERVGLWQAQTPQLFRAQTLLDAMVSARTEQAVITDESSAMERVHQYPVLVEALHPNFKITRETDRALAERLLS